jgi:hypothetical protein
MNPRREFDLPEEETEFLGTSFPEWEAVKEASKWILLPNFRIPEGYTVDNATAAIEIPTNYPMARLDMVYFYPDIKRKDGLIIRQTESYMNIDGKNFQRWSRHYPTDGPNKWDPMNDSIITHVMAIEDWLAREFKIR